MNKKEAAEKLYQINSWISGRFITKIQKPTYEDMYKINEMLGFIIKELRKEEEK